MEDDRKSDKKGAGSAGINAGGNVTIGNISGQIAVGKNIIQTQSMVQFDLEELKKNLHIFQKCVSMLALSSEDHSMVNDTISAAIKEADKEKPILSKIKEKFESGVNTIKKAGKTIKDIAELYEAAEKIAKLIGISLPFLS